MPAEPIQGSLDNPLASRRYRCGAKLALRRHLNHLLGVMKSLQDGKPIFPDDRRQVAQVLIEIGSVL